MGIDFNDIEKLGLSDEVAALLLYFVNELGLTIQEGLPIASNWSRSEPQTDEEIRQGVLDERHLRDTYYGDGTPRHPES